MKKNHKALHHRVHNFLVPHKENQYSPQIFAYSSVIAVVVMVGVLQGAYFLTSSSGFGKGNFLASVLPGALISLTNADRQTQKLDALIEDPLLDQAAQLKANDMAAKGYFAHVTPEGYQPWHWFDVLGYTYEYAGENLAVNFSDSKDVESAWMNSPTHRANIVKPQYTRIGIATADGMYKGEQVTFVVQLFAKPAPVVTGKIPTSADSVNANTGTKKVLGAETQTVLGFIDQVMTSPTHTIIYILSALAGCVLILLSIAIVVHLRTGLVEIFGGAFCLLLLIVGFLIFDATQSTVVEVPQDTASATSL